MCCSPSQLVEFGGHITLSKTWAYHLLERMKFVRRKATTSKSRQKPHDFNKLKEDFLADDVSVVKMEENPPELFSIGTRQVLTWFQQHLGPWNELVQSGLRLVESVKNARLLLCCVAL